MKHSIVALTTVVLTLWSGHGWANESFNSEFSHFAAGVGIAAAATAIADHYGAGENRAWIGFGTSVAISAVLEGVQIAANGSSQVGPSALDFASNLLGAALGAWVTDRFVLMPVVSKDAEGRRVVGVTARWSF